MNAQWDTFLDVGLLFSLLMYAVCCASWVCHLPQILARAMGRKRAGQRRAAAAKRAAAERKRRQATWPPGWRAEWGEPPIVMVGGSPAGSPPVGGGYGYPAYAGPALQPVQGPPLR